MSSQKSGSNWDVEQDIKKSPLWSYCGNSLALFKCPAMNYWFGAFDGKHTEPFSLGPRRVYLKSSDLIDPGPTETILFLDAREDGITGGSFGIDMTGFPDHPEKAGFYQDMPASYHHRAGGCHSLTAIRRSSAGSILGPCRQSRKERSYQ